MDRRFVPFNPQEPRPPRVPKIEPGVLVAAFDDNAVRVTDWVPLRPDYTVSWGPNITVRAATIVAWDGADAYISLLLPRLQIIAAGTLTAVLPGSRCDRTPWWRR